VFRRGGGGGFQVGGGCGREFEKEGGAGDRRERGSGVSPQAACQGEQHMQPAF